MTSLNADDESANVETRSNDFYSQDEASEFFAHRGLSVSPKTLAKLRSVGGGPEFRKFGRYAVYERQALADWAQSRLSAPRSCTAATHAVSLSRDHIVKMMEGRQATLADSERREAYAKAASHGHRASWSDPERRAARMAKAAATPYP